MHLHTCAWHLRKRRANMRGQRCCHAASTLDELAIDIAYGDKRLVGYNVRHNQNGKYIGVATVSACRQTLFDITCVLNYALHRFPQVTELCLEPRYQHM